VLGPQGVAITQIVVLLSRNPGDVTVGSIAKLAHEVDTKAGKLPKGHASKVHELEVIDGHPVARIDGPTGQHWVSKSSLHGV